ncbi:hypothetical protein TNCV_2387061 [Trichonephila clavipes]|nr:hypothetical protein TNCV_2387061 [Trichonephila clavipes]
MRDMVQRSREKEQKQQHVYGTETILLNGCTSTGIRMSERVNIIVAIFSYSRAFGGGPRNFEPRSSDKKDN